MPVRRMTPRLKSNRPDDAETRRQVRTPEAERICGRMRLTAAPSATGRPSGLRPAIRPIHSGAEPSFGPPRPHRPSRQLHPWTNHHKCRQKETRILLKWAKWLIPEEYLSQDYTSVRKYTRRAYARGRKPAPPPASRIASPGRRPAGVTGPQRSRKALVK